MSQISESRVSEPCKDIAARVGSFLERPIDGDESSTRPDATHPKACEDGRIVSVAAMIATSVDTGGRRECAPILGLGPLEAAIHWFGFPRGLEKRGPKGIRLVISDAHDGSKAAIVPVFGATWQGCRVHLMRDASAYVPGAQHRMGAAAIRIVLVQADHAAGSKTRRRAVDRLRARIPKLAP